MNTPKIINSNSYWDTRFSGNWEDFEGPRQSRFFARIAIEGLPQWLMDQIKRQGLTLADWGCAQGDGTDVWASFVPAEQVAGVDFSSVAIRQAAQRYPTVRFINADWLAGSDAQHETFDVIFSSNTLEHFHRPYDVLKTISGRARKAIVLALPYREFDRIEEHFFSFFPENIPSQLANGFRLTWSKVVDCRSMQDTLWAGHQIILVYANSEWTSELALTLNDCHVEKDDVATQVNILKSEAAARNGEIADLARTLERRVDQIADLTQTVGERHGQIADLTQTLGERRGQIADLTQALEKQHEEIASLMQAVDERNSQITRLTQEVSERDAHLHSADAYRYDKEIYIAQLLQDIKMRNSGLLGVAWNTKQRLKRIPHYVNRSHQLVATGGAPALIRAVKAKLQRKWSSRLAAPGSVYSPLNNGMPVASADHRHFAPLLQDELVVITGVPFDDVGGGQRAAQLSRCALKTGRKVIYIYIYPKYDFATGQHSESDLDVPGLTHLSIDRIDPASLLDRISEHATILLELPHPKILPFLEACNVRGLRSVFELIDDWETSLGGDWFSMETYRQFVEKAPVVVGTAKLLVKRLVDLGRKDALYLPNASNEYIFDKYKSYERPADLPKRGKKTALYFGSLYGEWFAWDWVIAAANANPHLDVVLIGDSPGKEGLPKNIHFLGSKKIDELPGYLQHSDMALLPFVPGKISDAVSPIKVFEYLFIGKPVVSTRLPEIVDYPGVHIADTPEDFARLCNRSYDSEALAHENDRFVSKNSWFGRLDQLAGEETSKRFASSVSAVILIHNNRNIIGRCLESLQTHGKCLLREIIVVDNASTDGGADFITENFPDVRVVVNPVNGCASGRNLGASLATGRYLAFFDSDQWFTSSSFLVEALQILSRDASVGVVGWAAGWFDRTRTDLGGMIADYCQNRAMNQEALLNGYRADIGYLGTGGFFFFRDLFSMQLVDSTIFTIRPVSKTPT
ncbi:glycosyltransferase [Cupriavidus nantongensis]|nr:glycosyltransferase [Cupriavidus nantongensis]